MAARYIQKEISKERQIERQKTGYEETQKKSDIKIQRETKEENTKRKQMQKCRQKEQAK